MTTAAELVVAASRHLDAASLRVRDAQMRHGERRAELRDADLVAVRMQLDAAAVKLAGILDVLAAPAR